MNKKEFLSRLKNALIGLSDSERIKSVHFYSECIDDRIEEGMSEYQAVSELGDFNDIVDNILMGYKEISGYNTPKSSNVGSSELPNNSAEHKKVVVEKTPHNVDEKQNNNNQNKCKDIAINLIKIAIVLGVYVLVFALIVTVFAVVFSIYVSVFATYLSLFLSSFAGFGFGIYAIFQYGYATGMMYIGISLVVFGLTVAIFMPFGKLFLKLNKKIFVLMKNCIKKNQLNKLIQKYWKKIVI